MRFSYIALLLILLGYVHAGTVTLTGTCTSNPYNDTIGFTLSNSGNVGAQDATISLYVLGIGYATQAHNVGAINPGTENSTEYVINTDAHGSFPAYFLVSYIQQGYQSYAAFPCLVNIKGTESTNFNTLQSQINISSKVRNLGSGAAEVVANVTNDGNTELNETFALILPPDFAYNRNATQSFSLPPYSSGTVIFNFSYPEYNVSAGGAIAAYYNSGETYYSILSLFVANSAAPVSRPHSNIAGFFSAIPYLILAILAIYALLIIKKYGHRAGNWINKHEKRDGLFLKLAITATAISAAYWSLFAVQLYYNFKVSFDFAQIITSMNYAVHHPTVVSGLQYIVFATHIAVDQLLVLPIYYLFQSGITLLVIQAVVLSLSGMLVFLIARDLKLGNFLSLALCMAFLLNPGMHGMIVHDYHVEFLIIPFTLLTFYFYMKADWKPFLVSLALLLLSMDEVVFSVFFLGVGLLYYDLSYTEDSDLKRKRLKMATLIILSSVVAYVAYTITFNSLTYSYSNTTRYAELPSYLQAIPFSFYIPSNFTNSTFTQSPISHFTLNMAPSIVLALSIGIFAFGLLILADPILTLLISVPWLFGIFFSYKSAQFLNPDMHYFSYVIGGMVVVSILAVGILRNGKSRIRFFSGIHHGALEMYIVYTMMLITIIVFCISLYIMKGAGISLSPFPNSTAMSNYYAVGSLASRIPAGSSVLTQGSLFQELYQRPNTTVELMGNYYWFPPQYILVDTTSIDQSEYDFFTNFQELYNYTLIAQNGTAELYREG